MRQPQKLFVRGTFNQEDFYCNRRYAAVVRLTAGWLALGQSTYCFKYASPRPVLGSKACLAHSYKGASPLNEIPTKEAPHPSELSGGAVPWLTALCARLTWHLVGFITNSVAVSASSKGFTVFFKVCRQDSTPDDCRHFHTSLRINDAGFVQACYSDSDDIL